MLTRSLKVPAGKPRLMLDIGHMPRRPWRLQVFIDDDNLTTQVVGAEDGSISTTAPAWKEVTLDLSPYVGSTVTLRLYHWLVEKWYWNSLARRIKSNPNVRLFFVLEAYNSSIRMRIRPAAALLLLLQLPLLAQNAELRGGITDPQGQTVAGATLHLGDASATSSSDGQFQFRNIASGAYKLIAEAPGFSPLTRDVAILPGQLAHLDLQFLQLSAQKQSIVITAHSLEPTIDLRNSEVFNRTLFTRDDQVFQQLNAGINAGQHEGGGKVARDSPLRLQSRSRRRQRRPQSPAR